MSGDDVISKSVRRLALATPLVLWAALIGADCWRWVMRDGGRATDVVMLAVSSGVVLVAIAALSRRGPRWDALALSAGLGMATLLGAELLVLAGLTWFPPVTSRAEYARRAGVPFDGRTKYEVYRALRTEHPDAVPHVHPCQWIDEPFETGRSDLLPLSGVSRATTLYGNEGGSYLVYESDRYGFNNPDSVWDAEAIDVALIGDSFVVGAQVPRRHSVPSLLSERGRIAMGLASGCVGPLVELGLLREYAAQLAPENVVWVYFEGNDLQELELERRSELLLGYLGDEPLQRLPERQEEIDAWLRAALARLEPELMAETPGDSETEPWPLEVLRLRYLRDFRAIASSYVWDPYYWPPPEAPSIELLARILDRARRDVSGWGGRLWFVYLTAHQRYPDRRDDGSYFHRDAVLEAVRRQGIPVIDFHTTVAALEDFTAVYPLGLPGHYSVEGYQMLADRIHREISPPPAGRSPQR